MDGKKKLEELVARLKDGRRSCILTAKEICSISDAYKAMEAERDALRDLIALAHPVMRECGWHLAPGCQPSGDGVLELAAAEVEEKFAAALQQKDTRHEG